MHGDVVSEMCCSIPGSLALIGQLGIDWDGSLADDVVLAMDETGLQYKPRTRTFVQRPIGRRVYVRSNRCQITASPVVSLAGSVICLRLIWRTQVFSTNFFFENTQEGAWPRSHRKVSPKANGQAR